MTKAIRNFTILASVATSILLFQNCSEVGFTVADNSLSKMGGSGINDGDGGVATDRETDGSRGNSGGDGNTNPTISDDQIRKICSDLRMNQSALLPLGNGARIVDSNGNTNLKALGSIATVMRFNGNMNILGLAAGGTIGTIDATSGNLLICQMSVGSLVNSSTGNITIVDGNIGDISNFHGNVRFINGGITGSIQNSTGYISGQ